MIKQILFGLMVGLIFAVVIFILTALFGCAMLERAPSVAPIVPASGWESTMRAVAKSNWIVTFCLLAFFSGIVTIAMDVKKIGMSIIIASVLTLFLGLAVHRFPTWMAVIGFIGSAGICLITVLKRKKALVEIIRGVQNYRTLMDTRTIDTELRHAQSKPTEKIVEKIKEKEGMK